MNELLELKEILLNIKEELERANDLKEIELGIEYDFNYKTKRIGQLEEKRKKKCKK